jgi:hypothetical protein
MYCTLEELRNTVDKLIETQGENAGCAAFLFTCNDVFEFNEKTNQDDYFSAVFTEKILSEVGKSDYIMEEVGELIDDEIRIHKNMSTDYNI